MITDQNTHQNSVAPFVHAHRIGFAADRCARCVDGSEFDRVVELELDYELRWIPAVVEGYPDGCVLTCEPHDPNDACGDTNNGESPKWFHLPDDQA